MLTIDCWHQIALRCIKLKEIRRLMITCSEIYKGFKRVDIWSWKFQRDFPDLPLHPWWEPTENYMLQDRYKGKMYALIGIGDKDHSTRCLYKYDPSKIEILNLCSWITDFKNGIRPYELVETDLTKPGTFALYMSTDLDGLEHIETLVTREDTIEKIMNLCNTMKYYCIMFAVVRLNTLDFEFNRKSIHSSRIWSICLDKRDDIIDFIEL